METSNKTWLWILITAVVLVLAWAGWQYDFFGKMVNREKAPLSGGDTTSDIESNLGAADLGNLNQDFEPLDKDLNSF